MEARHPARSGYATVSAIVFLLVAVVQVIRAANGWPVQLNGIDVPVVASWFIAAFATFMAAWGWRSR